MGSIIFFEINLFWMVHLPFLTIGNNCNHVKFLVVQFSVAEWAQAMFAMVVANICWRSEQMSPFEIIIWAKFHTSSWCVFCWQLLLIWWPFRIASRGSNASFGASITPCPHTISTTTNRNASKTIVSVYPNNFDIYCLPYIVSETL